MSLSPHQGHTLSHLATMSFLPLYLPLRTLTLRCSGHPTPTRYSLDSPCRRCLQFSSTPRLCSSPRHSLATRAHGCYLQFSSSWLLLAAQPRHCPPSVPRALTRVVSCPGNASPSSDPSTQDIPCAFVCLNSHDKSPVEVISKHI